MSDDLKLDHYKETTSAAGNKLLFCIISFALTDTAFVLFLLAKLPKVFSDRKYKNSSKYSHLSSRIFQPLTLMDAELKFFFIILSCFFSSAPRSLKILRIECFTLCECLFWGVKNNFWLFFLKQDIEAVTPDSLWYVVTCLCLQSSWGL